MKNAEWCIKNNIRLKDLCFGPTLRNPQEDQIGYYNGITIAFHELYRGKRLGKSAAESILTWLDMEHKEPILDDVERKYLSAVIRPFRDKVQVIAKHSSMVIRKEYLMITTTEGALLFPDFDAGTMYKGMKLDRAYAPKELGL